MICFAPLIMAGYLMTVQTSWHHTENVDGMIIDVQTCETGLGLHVRGTTSGLYGLGTQYGFTYQFDDKWSLTFQPRAGFSYTSTPRYELPATTQFELGSQLILGYGDMRVSLDYWHLSNAGLVDPNIGLDTISLMAGWRF